MWWSIFEKYRAVLGEDDFQYIHVIWDLLVIYERASMLTNIDVSCSARCWIGCGQMADQVRFKGNTVLVQCVLD